MNIPKTVVKRLAGQHPYSKALLKAFVPLLDAQDTLAETLPAAPLPELDRSAFALGRAWLPAHCAEPSLYFDPAFLKTAPKKIASAAARGFPERKEELRALGAFLAKDSSACLDLATLGLRGADRKISGWAKKHGQDAELSALFARQLAGAAARRVAVAARAVVLPPWNKNVCPICGSRPHGSSLRGKEGKRYLQCSMCRTDWIFSRTTCPLCEQDSPGELPLFFLENAVSQRAEGCDRCKRYLLGVDMRELTEDTPLELLLLCMMPLDLLMREKGYAPGPEAD